MADQTDPFDTLLTLEDTLYTAAYTLGASDGAHAGRIEGRIFGLEKGFEKFAGLGQLHGRSVMWASRLPIVSSSSSSSSSFSSSYSKHLNHKDKEEKDDAVETTSQLPRLPQNERLRNNTILLHSLTDLETFDTANTEEAVADFDDRVKRAGAKAKVIERIVGEAENATFSSSPMSPDYSPARGKGPVRVVGESRKMGTAKKGDDSIEDFAGSKLLR